MTGGKFKKRLIVSLVFGVLVFVAFTIYAEADAVFDAYKSFQWSYLPLIVACTSTNYLFRFWKWDYYTAELGIRPPFKQNVIIFFAGFVMAVTPGKFGEVLKSYLLKQENTTPISKSAPIILAERLTDFIGLIFLVIIGAWVFGYGRRAVALFALFFFGITALLSWRRGSEFVLQRLEKIPLIAKRAHHLRDAYESIYLLLRFRPLAIATALSIMSWAFECLGYWIILNTFGAPPTVLKATFIYAFSTIVGAVTMLPGGLGATETSLTGLAMLAGTSKSVAVASTFIIRTATLWYAVVLGAAVMLLFQKKLGVRLSEIDLQNAESPT